MRRYLLSAAAFLAALAAPVSQGQAQSDPFGAVNSLVAWFDQLNRNWSKIVTREERAQYLRKLDRLLKATIDLQGKSEFLLNVIPDSPPDGDERAQLSADVDQVYAALDAFKSAAGEVQDQVALAQPELSRHITRTGVARGVALRVLDAELMQPANRWQPDVVRSRLKQALVLLDQTQTSVARFRNRIAAQR